MKCGIESHAAFYCGHLIDDRSLTPLAVAWATIVALWFHRLPGWLRRPAGEAAGGPGHSAMVLPRRPTHESVTTRQAQPNFSVASPGTRSDLAAHEGRAERRQGPRSDSLAIRISQRPVKPAQRPSRPGKVVVIRTWRATLNPFGRS
jgi:hypothetical protein